MKEKNHKDEEIFFRLDLNKLVEMGLSRGLSARKVALGVGMSQPGFSAMVARGSMETKILLKAAKLLEVAPGHLLTELMPPDLRAEFGVNEPATYSTHTPLSMAAEPLSDADFQAFIKANMGALQRLIDREQQ